MKYRNYIFHLVCLFSSFAFSGVESDKPVSPPKNESALDRLAHVEQEEMRNLIAHEQLRLAAKKEEARSLLLKVLWMQFGSMKECIVALHGLLKPIVDNHETQTCKGGHDRLEHFMHLYERLIELHKTSLLTDNQRCKLIETIKKEALNATSAYNQAFEESEFNLPEYRAENDEAKAFLDLLITGDIYYGFGANFTCGVLLNAGCGGGLGIRETPAGEMNCAFMGESVCSAGLPQLACTKIVTNQQSFSFYASDKNDKGSNGDHVGFLCVGGTCVKKGVSTLHEGIFCAPFSFFKAGIANFFNVSPKLSNLAQFQHNLGLTLDTCCKNLPDDYEQLLDSCETIQAVEHLIKQFRAEFSTKNH